MQSISNLPLPTNDLRGESKDYLRENEHKAKWGRTDAPVRGCSHSPRADWDVELCDKCNARPPQRGARQYGRHASYKKINEYKGVTKKKVFARKAIGNEIEAATDAPVAGISDTSSDESINDAGAAAVPDAEVMYSFDAKHGPTHGSDILGAALNQAVERFENKQTEKLVQEYDVIEDVADAGNDADVDEDGFEIVDYANLQ
jgi:hypothetical protein